MTKDKKQQLSEAIQHNVLTLQWAPGQDLDESSLSLQFGLSRTPLREVFRDLAGQGFLSQKQHRNTRVAELSHQTLREFFQAAPMIYSAVMRLAAENRTTAQVEQLEAIQNDFEQALASADGQARSLANHRFHKQTALMANNRYLLPSFERLLIDHTRIGQTFFRAAGPDQPMTEASDHHRQMIAAISAGDVARAGDLAIEHWNLSRAQFAQFVMPQSLDVNLGQWIQGEPS